MQNHANTLKWNSASLGQQTHLKVPQKRKWMTKKDRGVREGRGDTTSHLSRLCSQSSTLASDGLETGLDALHRTSTAARPAFEEVKACVFVQLGFSPLARMTHDVFPWKMKRQIL